MKKTLICAAALCALNSGAWAGLNATVYDGWNLDASGNISTAGLSVIGSFEDPSIDHWNGDIYYSWSPLGRGDLYTVTWSGYLITPDAGAYQFRTTSDDGIQVFVDSIRTIHSPGLQWFGVSTGSANLTAGAHAFDVRFYENGGNDGVRLEWLRPGANSWEVVPTSALSVTQPVPEPESWALALAGLLTTSTLARRRRG